MWKFRTIARTGAHFQRGKLLCSSAKGEEKLPKAQDASVNPAAEFNARVLHKPNKIDKILLVWDKKYKTIEEVPNFITCDQMERARNWARIKISIYMMIGTGIGCIIMVYSGKQAAARGESVSKMNLEWHRKMKEEAEKEKAIQS
ncbi:hypothetical protein J437_LFUL000749 [Ladona fulva]|uniref:Uncharacterized protein n=1 Tax=Ladona fulva TaxID=123851 RepID=A0A8K0PAA0_LADFU|nr:hypothetical protein J437_LFUL000749 [Ladona fulva]